MCNINYRTCSALPFKLSFNKRPEISRNYLTSLATTILSMMHHRQMLHNINSTVTHPRCNTMRTLNQLLCCHVNSLSITRHAHMNTDTKQQTDTQTERQIDTHTDMDTHHNSLNVCTIPTHIHNTMY